MPFAILAMALGAFAIGLTEFAVMGLLPQIAGETAVSIPVAGNLITAYAIGVVVGAPLLTAAAVRLSRRTMLVLFMALFAAGNALAAVAPSFGVLVAARFLSGLPHGAFFGVASLVAASLVPPHRRASAIASMVLGLTVANLVGVPAAALLGGLAGWRLAFVVIAALALLCVAGVLVFVPRGRVEVAPGLRAELAVLRSPAVLLVLGVVAVGTGGLFAFYSYIAPMMIELTGYGAGAIPALLAVFGLGMTVGTVLGGRLADRFDHRKLLVVLLGGQTALLVAAVPAVRSPVLAPIVIFGVGVLGLALIPAVQSVVMDAASAAPALASAAIQSGFNTANALGAALGGMVIAAGFGLAAPAAVGAVLAALGMGLALLMLRHSRRASAATPARPEAVTAAG
ncbi:MFS transporter [Pseudonocardia sp. GCM10023141]|uniref:MFS transporter n=1 Tax=Pseudonocardia sp. GCM10023141 TaxID=3252653 RepID=UPI003615E57E